MTARQANPRRVLLDINVLFYRLIKSILEETKNKPLVKDMEDALQFVVAQNNRCTHIITFNKTDFDPFDIGVVLPGKIRSIF